MLLCVTHISKNNVTIYIIINVALVGMNLANLDNWSTTTTKMASFPCHVIKSIETISPTNLSKLEEVYIPQISCTPTWCSSTSHKCGHNVQHPLSCWANTSFYLKPPLWSFHHNVQPLTCHGFFAWPLCPNFLLAHRHKIVFISANHLKR